MSTLAQMPEHFTDTLGNWKSRAKETYRRTALAQAHARFCKKLGVTKPPSERLNQSEVQTSSNSLSSQFKVASRNTEDPTSQNLRAVKIQSALSFIHGSQAALYLYLPAGGS